MSLTLITIMYGVVWITPGSLIHHFGRYPAMSRGNPVLIAMGMSTRYGALATAGIGYQRHISRQKSHTE